MLSPNISSHSVLTMLHSSSDPIIIFVILYSIDLFSLSLFHSINFIITSLSLISTLIFYLLALINLMLSSILLYAHSFDPPNSHIFSLFIDVISLYCFISNPYCFELTFIIVQLLLYHLMFFLMII